MPTTNAKKPKTRTPEQREARRRFYEYCMARRGEDAREPERPLWENAYWCQEVLSSSPVECVVKLYEGAIQFLRKAEHAIEQGDVAGRYHASERAARIIEHLSGTLDKEQGGDIAEKLDAVYKTALRRMVAINTHNEARAARDVVELLDPLARAWRELLARQAAEAAHKGGRPLFADAPETEGEERPKRSISATV